MISLFQSGGACRRVALVSNSYAFHDLAKNHLFSVYVALVVVVSR